MSASLTIIYDLDTLVKLDDTIKNITFELINYTSIDGMDTTNTYLNSRALRN